MDFTAVITNNTGGPVSFNMRDFFTSHDGPQLVNLADEGTHQAGVECYPPQAEKRFRSFCATNGHEYSQAEGLYLSILMSE